MGAFMQKRRLGKTDLHIAPLVLGGNVFGWTANEKTSFELMDRFVEAGFNAIDSADVYSKWVPGNRGGESETIIGDWMKSRGTRDQIVLITKVGGEMGPNQKGLSAAYIEQAVNASLRRLKTATIDVYLSHWPDSVASHEETLAAYKQLIQKGKIRCVGASNFDAGQLGASLAVAKSVGLPRYDVFQPEYNLYDRGSFDGPLRDLCMAQGIGVITYCGLANGFLSGKYRSDADLGQSPRGGAVKNYLNVRGMRILAALDAVSSRQQASCAEVALAWIMAKPGITAPIASATCTAMGRVGANQLTVMDGNELTWEVALKGDEHVLERMDVFA
jgi:aryl-alcohol dehydrogenase-like predicted oxidoreductase